MKAKDILIKAGTVLSAVLFLSAGLGFSSQAAAQSASLKIPVKISTSGAAPEETYTVTIERDPSNPNAPLPSPNQVSVKGTGAKDYILEFPEMVYTTEGDYKYTIKQTVGTQSNLTYDSRTYTLLVKTTEITTDANGKIADIPTKLSIYVPNIIEGKDIKVIAYANITGTWAAIPVHSINYQAKTMDITINGSSTICPIYK